MESSFVFFFKQKTAYELRISDWSSDVCSSDLGRVEHVAVMDLDVEILECGRAAAPTQQYADFASLRNEQAGRVATDKAARAGHKHRLVRIDLHRVLFLSNDESTHRLLGWETELREDRS